jgi:hypothetical protein
VTKRRSALGALTAMSMMLTLIVTATPAVGDEQMSFNRISTFGVYTNNADAGAETVSEIVAVTPDGMTLVYTDGPGEQVGFVDISDPADPLPDGVFDVGGEPTSVDVWGDYVLVAVNSSPNFVNPSGELVVIDISGTPVEVASLPLGGQPDSIKVSPSGTYVAIVIENERDEDIVVDGVEGGLPQAPAGLLQVIELDEDPTSWTTVDVDLTGLATYGSDDPEPEFVDINSDDIAVVSLQENNWVVLVDLATATVIDDFDAGTVDLTQIDTVEEDVISLTGSLDDVPREPDAIAWINDELIGTANEGDLFGGSRGFTIFDQAGGIAFDSGNSYEHLAVRHGHYPEGRSENKGSEPEGIEFGTYGGQGYLFVGSERGSFIAVYTVNDEGEPTYKQFLPGPLGPEGLLAIPSRNLFVASGEGDDPTFGVRATIQIYQLQQGAPVYPHIVSADDRSGTPIPWSALSALAADPSDPNTLYAVWDSFYAESRIFTIDVSTALAVITDALTITGGTGNYDPEGLAMAPDGNWWIASEGNATDSRPNRLLEVDSSTGEVIQEIRLPEQIEACRTASTNRGSLGAGFEGLTVVDGPEGPIVYVAQQRGWDYTTPECEDLDDDPTNANAGEPGWTRIWSYDPASGAWDWAPYELQPLPANASWVGLSEIVELPNKTLGVIERDNRTGDWATLKTLARFDLERDKDGRIERSEKLDVFDLLPSMHATNGWISDKPEGFTVAADGQVYVVTDNDGVDDWSGETQFLRLGHVGDVFRPGLGLGRPAGVPPASPPGSECAPGCGKGNGGNPPGLVKNGDDWLPPGLVDNDHGKENGNPFHS